MSDVVFAISFMLLALAIAVSLAATQPAAPAAPDEEGTDMINLRGSDGYGFCSQFYDQALEPINAPLRRVAHRMSPPEQGRTVAG